MIVDVRNDMLQLSVEENIQIDNLLSMLMEKYTSPSDKLFLMRARIYANQLPERILRRLNEFRYLEANNGSFIIKKFKIDDRQIGLTPGFVDKDTDELSASREGYFLMILCSFLGDVMGWSSQRNGALINNILPVKKHEKEQLSTGSMSELDWHTEEAFHEYRADYLSLMCLRNPDQIPTILGSIKDVPIRDEMKKILFEPRFIFQTDKNFQKENICHKPESVLFGHYDNPYIRIDPSFMEAMNGDEEAHVALSYIISQIKNILFEVVLEPGDILFIDNYRVVHGRKAFKPRFDGTDRWLKRVNITLDLRKSRTHRDSDASRVINL